MLSGTTTPARSGTVNGGVGGGGPLSSSRAGGRANGGVRLLWRGALEFGDGIQLEGIAFISHLSFSSAPQASSSKLIAPSPIFPPRGSTSTAPATPTDAPGPSSTSASTSVSQPPTSSASKAKTKRAVLFSSGVESASNLSAGCSVPVESAEGSGTPKAVLAPPFAPALPSPSPFPLTSPTDLMLSLALESLKGRPSIRYRGLVRIGASEDSSAKVDGSVEGEGGVRLYTDPRCPLILNFLRRQLLLTNHSADAPIGAFSPLDSTGRTTHAILIALGDESFESSNLLIYAQLAIPPPPSSSSYFPTVSETQPMTLHLGRYVPTPPTPHAKPPRPDDPAPRRPSLAAIGSTKEREKAKRKLAQTTSGGGSESGARNKVARTASGVEEEVGNDDEPDVFGSRRRSSSSSLAPAAPVEGKRPAGSGKVAVVVSVKEERSDSPDVTMSAPADDAVVDGEVDSEMKAQGVPPPSSGRKKAPPPNPKETHNKAHIKSATLQALLERGISKDHPEFKELWNWVVRGSGFALRASMGERIIPALEVLGVVGKHLELYLPAEGS